MYLYLVMVVHSVAHISALCTGKCYFPLFISHFLVPNLEDSFMHFCMSVTRGECDSLAISVRGVQHLPALFVNGFFA